MPIHQHILEYHEELGVRNGRWLSEREEQVNSQVEDDFDDLLHPVLVGLLL